MDLHTVPLVAHLNIRQKLIGLIAVSMLTIVGFLTVYFPTQEVRGLESGMIGKADRYGTFLSTQLRSAVAFTDQETAREVLASVSADPDVVAVVLFAQDGATLYSVGQPSPWAHEASRGVVASQTFHAADRIAVVAPVQSLEGPRGTVVVEMSTHRLLEGQHRVTVTALAAAVVALLFGVLVAWAIAASLSRRLQAIAEVASAVTRGEPRGVVIVDTSLDEIGVLARAFDAMLAQLEAERQRLRAAVRELTVAEDALGRANRDLEDRVQARTAELTSLNQQLVQEMSWRSAMELELRQAQKLESVGRLAAGIAHEINTPIQFVSDSCHFLSGATSDLSTAVAAYRALLNGLGDGTVDRSEVSERVEALEEESDVVYLLENLPLAVSRSLEGAERVAKIVSAMKAFAHPERRDKAAADINHAVTSTLTISANEYKYVADVRTELGVLPPVICHVGEINQVILNVVVNAAHAIEDVVRGTGRKGEIVVRTAVEGEYVQIAISDTGGGIPDAIVEKIFDPFFTTKEIGKGTGQGLAIARSVMVDKHGGRLTLETEVGRGTTFTLWLPIAGSRTLEPAPVRSEGVTA